MAESSSPGGPGMKGRGAVGTGLDQAPEVCPPCQQVTPTSSRASTTGAFPRAASRRSRTPPSPWGPNGWTVPPPTLALKAPDPPRRPPSPEPAIVSARSIWPRGSCPCPSCSPSCSCWREQPPPAEGGHPEWSSPLHGRGPESSPRHQCGVVSRCRAPACVPTAGLPRLRAGRTLRGREGGAAYT